MAKKSKTELVGYIHKSTPILTKPPKKINDYFKLLITLEPIRRIMSHRRAKRVRKIMRERGMEITSVKGRKLYKNAKRLAREGKI